MNFKLVFVCLIMLVIKRNFMQSTEATRQNGPSPIMCQRCKIQPALNNQYNYDGTHIDPPLCKDCTRQIKKSTVPMPKLETLEYEDGDIGDENISARKQLLAKDIRNYHASPGTGIMLHQENESENVIGDLVVRVCNRFIDKVRKAQRAKQEEKELKKLLVQKPPKIKKIKRPKLSP